MTTTAAKLTTELARALADVRPLVQQLTPAIEGAPAAPVAPIDIVPRPWNLEAAMALIPPAPTASRSAPPAAAAPALAVNVPRQRRWPRLAAAVAALLAVAALGLATTRWLHVPAGRATSGVTHAKTASALLTPVTGSPPPNRVAPASATSFPEGTSTVYLAVRLAGSLTSPALTFSIVVQTANAWTQLPAKTFVVDASTPAVVPISAPSGPLAPGTYRITAAIDGTAVGATSFVID